MRNQGTRVFEYENADTANYFQQAGGVIVGPDPDTKVVPAKSASFNTAGFCIHQTMGYAVELSWPATGTPVGTLKLQACVDPALNFDTKPDAGLVNWEDVPLATVALTGIAGSQMFIDPTAFYRWVRVVWVRTSGNISLTARIQFKGIG